LFIGIFHNKKKKKKKEFIVGENISVKEYYIYTV